MKPSLRIVVYFGTTATGSGLFRLNFSTLNGTDILGGDIGTAVDSDTNTLSFRRGITSQLFDAIDPATGEAQLNNEDRLYDPQYADGDFYGFIKPGLRALVEANSVVIFDGFVADFNLDYQVGGRSTAKMLLEDGLAILGRQDFDEWTATAGQTAGDRYTDILNRGEVGWPGGARDIDTGVSVLQGDLVSWGSNVLNYAQLVAQSDLGTFFASRDGLITFRDRHANIGSTASVSFADDGSGIAFQGVQSTFGAEIYFNRIVIDREDGIAQTYTTATAVDDGVRSLSIAGTLQDSDSQALDMATYLANIYATGDTRISMLRICLDDTRLTAAQITQVLELDLTSLVDVTFTPNGVGDPIEQTCQVQGIDHDITVDLHWVTLWLTKFEQNSPFILNDAVFGKLNGTAGVLTF